MNCRLDVLFVNDSIEINDDFGVVKVCAGIANQSLEHKRYIKSIATYDDM